MTWGEASFVVWGLLALAVIAVQLLGYRRRARVVTIDLVLRRAMDARLVRGAVVVAWMWLGWHAFAR